MCHLFVSPLTFWVFCFNIPRMLLIFVCIHSKWKSLQIVFECNLNFSQLFHVTNKIDFVRINLLFRISMLKNRVSLMWTLYCELSTVYFAIEIIKTIFSVTNCFGLQIMEKWKKMLGKFLFRPKHFQQKMHLNSESFVRGGTCS